VKSFKWPDYNLAPINLLSLGRESSPCRGLCRLNNGKCVGCLRTIDEITDWAIYEPQERREILVRIFGENNKMNKAMSAFEIVEMQVDLAQAKQTIRELLLELELVKKQNEDFKKQFSSSAE